MSVYLSEHPDGILLALHVQPAASKAGFAGLHGDALKLKVSAPPVDGQANKAVIHFLSQFFAVPKTSVTIVKGQSSRHKTVLVRGAPDELKRKAGQALSADRDS